MLNNPRLARWQTPRLSAEERWVGGVCGAIAAEIGVQPIIIRACFIVLTTSGGWGLPLYALCWGWFLSAVSAANTGSYKPEPKGASSLHRHLGVLMVVVALLLLTQSFAVSLFGGQRQLSALVWPVSFVLVGGLIAWSEERSRSGGSASVARIVAGVVVAVVGLTFSGLAVVDRTLGLLIVVVVVVLVAGSSVVVGPSLIRMGNTIDVERSERILSDERAQIAAHLHDSVLQTLALIQRHAGDSSQVKKLARQQERELRGWLYGAKPTTHGTTRIGPALEEAASAVETLHGVPIEVVSVGDSDDCQPEEISGLVAAAREAMVNASLHSGASSVDVFVERSLRAIDVFVRDTGKGFDLDSVANDRHGVSESIFGRMHRLGGKAVIETELGSGTEVELHLPLERTTANRRGNVSFSPSANAERNVAGATSSKPNIEIPNSEELGNS